MTADYHLGPSSDGPRTAQRRPTWGTRGQPAPRLGDALSITESGDQLKSTYGLEDAVMGDKRYTEPHSGGGDPAVAIVELVAEGVSDLLAPQAQPRAHGDYLVPG